MSSRTKPVKRIAIVMAALLTLLCAGQGCKKEEPTAQQPAKPSMEQAATAAKDTAETTPETAQVAAAETVAAATEQTTCPIMDGNPINKALFVEYKGKKVYFCCKGCEEKFLADPEKYVAKLPQFKE